jgi:hypothetical protein
MSEEKTNNLPRFIVDVDLPICLNKDIYHLVGQPTLETLKNLERKFPDVLISTGTGNLKSKNVTKQRNLYTWELIIKEVGGYPFSGKNWKEKVPTMDKIRVINDITKVKTVEKEDILGHFGSEVAVECSYEFIPIYTVANQAGITLPQTHIFKQPGIEDIEYYEEITSYNNKMGKGKIKFTSRPMVENLNQLYDKLIHEAHGFQCKDNLGPLEITAKVPVLHRIIAVRALFDLASQEISTFEGN